MQSLASLMLVNTIGDIAPLEDFKEENCECHLLSFRNTITKFVFLFKLWSPIQSC